MNTEHNSEFLRRSSLIVPINNEKFVAKANSRGADAIILDLEDSIVPHEKNAARILTTNALKIVKNKSTEVLIRVNNEPRLLEDDIRASVINGVTGIVIPKVNEPYEIKVIDYLISREENNKQLDHNSI